LKGIFNAWIAYYEIQVDLWVFKMFLLRNEHNNNHHELALKPIMAIYNQQQSSAY